MGAHWTKAGHADGHFNGKLGALRLHAGVLAPGATDARARRTRSRGGISQPTFGPRNVRDLFRRAHGRIVNMAARGVTGRGWTGERWSWQDAPEQYERDPLPRRRPR